MGIKDFCKDFVRQIKSPEVKSSDFITQVISILWMQYRPLIMYTVVIPNITYAFLLIVYMCYYLEGPPGGELGTLQLYLVILLALLWVYLIYNESIQRFTQDEYLKSIYNKIDIFQFTMSFIIIYSHVFGSPISD